MNILLWYLPYALFSGVCDVVLSEGGTRTEKELAEPASANAAQASGRGGVSGTFRVASHD
jgi:hypothetical protein